MQGSRIGLWKWHRAAVTLLLGVVVGQALMLNLPRPAHAEKIRLGDTECFYETGKMINPIVAAAAERGSGNLNLRVRLRNLLGAQQGIAELALRHHSLSIPSVPRAPSGWYVLVDSETNEVHWAEATDEDSRLVLPGREENFGMETPGLPGIVTFFARGDTEDLGIPKCPDEAAAESVDIPFKALYDDSITGQTVGLVAVPSAFDPVKYTDYILDLKNQSFTLGWIRTGMFGTCPPATPGGCCPEGKCKDTAEILDAYLQAIITQLSAIQDQKIPVTTGRAVLELAAQFMQYVESNSCKEFECPVPEGQSPKPLTSEAYALMYFNMDYFATQVAKACNLPAPQVSPSPKRKSKAAGKK